LNKQSPFDRPIILININYTSRVLFDLSASSLLSCSLHLALVPMRPTAVIGPLQTFAEASPKDSSLDPARSSRKGKSERTSCSCRREEVLLQTFDIRVQAAMMTRLKVGNLSEIVVKHDIISSAPAP